MMTEKIDIAELIDAANNTTWTLSEGGVHEYDDLKLLVDTAYAYIELVKAATALPNYITALAEAERALQSTLNELWDERHSHQSEESFNDEFSEERAALTTIRQLARGNTDEAA